LIDLSLLNPLQLKAVTHTEGPVLILAGAGSGKTRALTFRIAHLLEKGVFPANIFAVTFTNKAADEMRERVVNLAGNMGRSVWVSTFHSLCVRILRMSGMHIGINNNFVIFDAIDQQQLIKNCMRELNINEKRFDYRAIQNRIENAKDELITADAYRRMATGYFEETVADIYSLYQRKLEKNNALDFNDLIMKTIMLFKAEKNVLESYQERFRYIMVDEYQDTNHAQYVLVSLLSGKYKNLCVVGDDDQSIYGWRGADIRNILDFEKDYPDVCVIKLEQNYRSTRMILKAANSVIKQNQQRTNKELWTENDEGNPIDYYCAFDASDEAKYVMERIKQFCTEFGYSYNDIAILYRINAQSRIFEEFLIKYDIPYTIVGGLRFYERKEIKDMLSYLRVILNPYDSVSLNRIINVPRRGIGNTTLEKLHMYADAQGISLFDAIKHCDEIPDVSGAPARAVKDFAKLLDALIDAAPSSSVSKLTQMIITKTKYIEELEQDTSPEAEGRIDNLHELLAVTTEFDKNAKPTANKLERLAEFLEQVTLMADVDTMETNGKMVTLMTLHSAKGLEFPIIFMVGMEESLLPHAHALDEPEEMEEERRLCYVGMTRAKERLVFTRAETRIFYGEIKHNLPSSFLEDIPGELVNRVKIGDDDDCKVIDLYAYVKKRVIEPPKMPVEQNNRPLTFRDTEFVPGDRVKHKQWGIGTVVAIKKDGQHTLISVAFPENGIKKLIADVAPIERIVE
jgi:DNA helicase-2/ATP-dependent DNA helicase PcrA